MAGFTLAYDWWKECLEFSNAIKESGKASPMVTPISFDGKE